MISQYDIMRCYYNSKLHNEIMPCALHNDFVTYLTINMIFDKTHDNELKCD